MVLLCPLVALCRILSDLEAPSDLLDRPWRELLSLTVGISGLCAAARLNRHEISLPAPCIPRAVDYVWAAVDSLPALIALHPGVMRERFIVAAANLPCLLAL